MNGQIDVDAILVSLGPEFDDPGEDPWGGANLEVPAFREEDVEFTMHSTKPETGMVVGTYPWFVEARHVPTGTRVIVGVDRLVAHNKQRALRGLRAVLGYDS